MKNVLTIVASIILVIVLDVVICLGLKGCGADIGSKIPAKEKNDISEDFASEEDYQKYLEKKQEIGRIDADDYFEKNTEIVNKTIVSKSKIVYKEKDIFEELTQRGFVDYPITSDYSMNGEYTGIIEVSDSSTDRHPMYQTSYITENGDMWSIIVVNDRIMASPISYNEQSDSSVPMIISEQETIESYDSNTKKFYETIPKESVVYVKRVDRIDSQTLDKLFFSERD